MQIELDHLFVCTSVGAPEAEDLVRFGLQEGPPNQHPGQGTANRRFAFVNAMLELRWVSDATSLKHLSSRPRYWLSRGRHYLNQPTRNCAWNHPIPHLL